MRRTPRSNIGSIASKAASPYDVETDPRNAVMKMVTRYEDPVIIFLIPRNTLDNNQPTTSLGCVTLGDPGSCAFIVKNEVHLIARDKQQVRCFVLPNDKDKCRLMLPAREAPSINEGAVVPWLGMKFTECAQRGVEYALKDYKRMYASLLCVPTKKRAIEYVEAAIDSNCYIVKHIVGTGK